MSKAVKTVIDAGKFIATPTADEAQAAEDGNPLSGVLVLPGKDDEDEDEAIDLLMDMPTSSTASSDDDQADEEDE